MAAPPIGDDPGAAADEFDRCWSLVPGEVAPKLALAVAALLGACVFLAIFAGYGLIYTDHTAAWLADPQGYIHAVLGGSGR